MSKRIPAAAAGILVLGAALGLGAGTASAAGTAGALDGTFGHGGIVSTDLGSPSAAALQSNGDIVVACRGRPSTNFGFVNGTLTLLCANLHITAQIVAGLICVLTLLLYRRELRKGLADVGFIANGLQAERRRIEGI